MKPEEKDKRLKFNCLLKNVLKFEYKTGYTDDEKINNGLNAGAKELKMTLEELSELFGGLKELKQLIFLGIDKDWRSRRTNLLKTHRDWLFSGQ